MKLSPFFADELEAPTLVVSMESCFAARSKLACVRVDGSKKALTCESPLFKENLYVLYSRNRRATSYMSSRSPSVTWSMETRSKKERSRPLRISFRSFSAAEGDFLLNMTAIKKRLYHAFP